MADNRLPKPKHIAIVMDGNGRWAQQHGVPRAMGHQEGLKATRRCIELAVEDGIETLSLFAFSTENWSRPSKEVTVLMQLLEKALRDEAASLMEQGIELTIVGDRAGLSPKLAALIEQVNAVRLPSPRMRLLLYINYSGRWHMLKAVQSLGQQLVAGELVLEDLNDASLSSLLTDGGLISEPDLLIRSSGEQRLSNFMLWHLAYTELYFTPVLWPDFDQEAWQQALDFYQSRERRFGRTEEECSHE